jgi:membrane protease subunit HflK
VNQWQDVEGGSRGHDHAGHGHDHGGHGHDGGGHDHRHDHDRGHGHDHHRDHDRERGEVRAAIRRMMSPTQPGGRLLIAVAALAWLLLGVYFVRADQQAVVLRLGRVAGAPVGPGVHWTWPWPVGEVVKIRARETRRLTIGFEAPDQVLGREAMPVQAEFLTGDRNIITIGLVAQYAIKDPVAYLFRFADVEALLRGTVESALAAVVMRRGVDSLLTTEKVAVQQEVHTLAQELVERYAAGVSILGVSLESVAPPEAVREAFNDVASAREDRDRIVREAQSYANEVLPVARGDAERLLRESEGYLQSRTSRAAGDAGRFASLAAEYARVPGETSTRLYLEAMEEVLPRMDKTIVESDADAIDFDFVRSRPATRPAASRPAP